MSQSPPLINRVFGKIGQAIAIRWRHFKKYQLEGEWEGLKLVRRVWQVRPLGRLGLAALVVGSIIAATQIEARAAQPLYADVALPESVTIVGAALFALGWAFALSAAINLPLWGYFIVAAYLSWHGLFIGGNLAGTPVFALPTIWMLLLGWRLARTPTTLKSAPPIDSPPASESRPEANSGAVDASGSTADPTPAPTTPSEVAPLRRDQKHWRFWLLIMCFGAAYLTYGAFRLRQVFTGDWEIFAPITLGLIYFAALTNRYTLKRFSKPDQLPKANRVFWWTLIVVAIFFALGISRDPVKAGSTTLLAMRGLLGIVDLFWLWLGAGLFQGAIGLGKWVTKESIPFLSERVTRILFPLIWIGVGVFSWIATHDLSVGVTVFAHNSGLRAWVNSWNDPDYWGVYYQFFASVIAVLLVIFFLIRRRWTNDKLAWLSGLWLAAYIGVVGFYANFESFGTLEADAAAPLAFWTGFTLIGGLVWEMAKSNADWSKVSNERILALIAWLLLMLSVCVVTLGAGLPELVMEYTLYSFFGVIYLGLPLVAYDFVCERKGYTALSMWNLLALFVIGALSASLVLGIDPNAGAHFLLAPIVWALGLALWGKPLARLSSALDGLVSGGALALGFVTFWMSPQSLPVPFLSIWQQWQDRYLLLPLNRPLLLDDQWWLTLIALGVGMLIGWSFTLRQRTGLKITASLVGAAIFALSLPRLPGFAIDASPSIAAEPTPTPVPPTPNPDWAEKSLGDTPYHIDVPPDWTPNPRGSTGLLINLVTPDGRALFSVTVFDELTDAEAVAHSGSDAWRSVVPDYTVTREPEWRTLGTQQVLWLEWSSVKNGSHGLDAYLVVAQGTLRFSLLSDPGAVGTWQSLFENIVMSLRQ